MAGRFPFGALELLARDYPRVTNAEKLYKYAKSRLPSDLASKNIGILGGGSGRMPMTLGDDLILKATRMPRGVMENQAEGDWLAPVPEAVWKSDDDLLAVVKRAPRITTPHNKKVTNDVIKAIEQARREGYNEFHPDKNIAYHSKVQDALGDAGWDSLLNYDTLWGDMAERNFGEIGDALTGLKTPVITDAGVLNKGIMDPMQVRNAISPEEWAAFRNDVRNAKKEGGLVQYHGNH